MKYRNIKEAISVINNYNNGIEGEYPKEMKFGWVSLDSSIYKDSWKIIIPGWKIKKTQEKRSDKLKRFLSRAPISFGDEDS